MQFACLVTLMKLFMTCHDVQSLLLDKNVVNQLSIKSIHVMALELGAKKGMMEGWGNQ